MIPAPPHGPRSADIPTDTATADPAPDLEALGDQIAELAAHIHAATYRLLVLISEFDRRDGWALGFATCAHWLSWRTGINLGAAREKVRVARALERLPRLSDGLRQGRLSYTKVRALTRVATPENEEELVELGLTATAAQTERLVRAWRRLDRIGEQEQEQIRHASRSLALHPSADGMWDLRGRLDPEVGAVLLRALEAAAEVLFRSADDRPSYAQRLADAAGMIAETALAAEPTHRADRYQVVLHVDAADLGESADRGGGELEDGVRVSAETSRRLSCDASKIVMHDGDGGPALTVGRRSRTVPAPIRRALDGRDRGCRFPGCGARFTDAHHIKHWADGGETRLDNLVLLCRRHHRAVHEDGFGVELRDGQPHFTWPDGRSLLQVPDVPRGPQARTAQQTPDLEDAPGLFEWEHRAAGLALDPWTASSAWAGEPFDIEFALDGLRVTRE